jgi:hypothetical protein
MRSREKLAPPCSTVLYVAEAPPAIRPAVHRVHRVDELRGVEPLAPRALRYMKCVE